jgi:hypothetical protein
VVVSSIVVVSATVVSVVVLSVFGAEVLLPHAEALSTTANNTGKSNFFFIRFLFSFAIYFLKSPRLINQFILFTNNLVFIVVIILNSAQSFKSVAEL